MMRGLSRFTFAKGPIPRHAVYILMAGVKRINLSPMAWTHLRQRLLQKSWLFTFLVPNREQAETSRNYFGLFVKSVDGKEVVVDFSGEVVGKDDVAPHSLMLARLVLLELEV